MNESSSCSNCSVAEFVNGSQGRAKVIIRTRDNRRFMVEMQFGINMY